MAPKKPLSPCRNICELDADQRWCTACGRTVQEIGNWAFMTNDERKAIMRTLSDRMKAANAS